MHVIHIRFNLNVPHYESRNLIHNRVLTMNNILLSVNDLVISNLLFQFVNSLSFDNFAGLYLSRSWEFYPQTERFVIFLSGELP